MFDLPIGEIMEQKKFLTAAPEASVRDVAKLMAEKNAGAVMVVKNDCLVGIVTERDVVFRAVAKGLNVESTKLASVMTADPIAMDPAKSYGQALLLMQENGFRHIPVVENGKPVGIVSSRNAMDPELEEFVSEERRREHHS